MAFTAQNKFQIGAPREFFNKIRQTRTWRNRSGDPILRGPESRQLFVATMLAQQFGYVLASILIGWKPTLKLRSKRQGRRAIAVPRVHIGACGKQGIYYFQVRVLRGH